MARLKNSREKLRFLIVGSLNTAIDYGLLFLLKWAGLPAVSANLISTTTAFVFSFSANRRYTFRSDSPRILRQIILFTAVTLFGLWVIQTIIIDTFTGQLSQLVNSEDMGLFLTKLIATAVTMVWNYLLYSKLVFRKKSDES